MIDLPPELRTRIETQARNLLFVYRNNIVDRVGRVVEGPQPISVNDAQQILVAMGLLTAQMIFDRAEDQIKELEARKVLPDSRK